MSSRELRDELSAVLAREAAASLRPVGWALVVLSSAICLAYQLRVAPEQARVLTPAAAATAGLILVLLACLRRWPVPASRAHALLAGMVGLVGLNCLLHFYVVGEPSDAAYLALFLVGAGSLLLSTPWFLGIAITALVAFALLMAPLDPTAVWPRYGFALAAAMALGTGVHTLRLNAILRDVRARIRGRGREQALRRSEERHRLLAEHALDIIWTLDAGDRLTYVSPSAETGLGYPPERAIGLHLQDLPFTPETLEHTVNQHGRLQRGELEQVTYEGEYVAPGGVRTWTETSARAIRSADGVFLGIHGVTRDIQCRKEAEEKLRAANSRLSATFHRARLGMLLMEPGGRCVEVNQALCAMLGYDEEEILSMSALELAHPSQRREIVRNRDLGIAGELSTWSGRVILVKKSGETVLTHVERTMIEEEGKPALILGVIEDRTQISRAQEALEKSEEQLRAVFEHVPLGVTLINSDGYFLAANSAFCAMIGFSEGELQGRPVLELVHPNDQVSAVANASRVPTGSLQQARRYIRKDGSVLATKITSMAMPRADGSQRFLGLVEDLSSAQYNEDQLRRMREEARSAEQVKATFLATVSHEIRTPLNTVIGTTELLLDADLSSEQRLHTQAIRTAGEALLGLINQILEYSKLEAGGERLALGEFDPRQLVEEVDQLLGGEAAAKGLAFSAEVAPAVPNRLFADGERVRQILVNLVANAIKFTDAGFVRVNLEARAHSLSRSARWLRMEVRDSGIGVAPGERSKIFEPFVQADQSTTRTRGGTGLGLAICSELAEQMGGSIGIEEGSGPGSIFFVELPMLLDSEIARSAKLARSGVEAPVAPAAVPVRPSRVVIAEDDPAGRVLAVQLLRKLGLEAEVVATGREVVDAVSVGSYGAVLMDCHMPEMDGFEATRRIRGLPRHAATPVIAMTAAALSGDRERCISAGMDDYIAKPVRLRDLRAALLRCGVLEPADGEDQQKRPAPAP